MESQVAYLQRVLHLLHIAEKLKAELRHSWLSSGRQESVADHSWRMALMVILLAPVLDQTVDLEKCLKMAILHDLAEAEVGDIPVFATQTPDRKQAKFAAERRAMEHLSTLLGPPLGPALYDLWLEYEHQASYEAQFVRAIDKLEVQLQHNEADLSTWLDQEKLMVFQTQWLHAHCLFDRGMTMLSDLIRNEAITRLRNHGEDVDTLRSAAQQTTAER